MQPHHRAAGNGNIGLIARREVDFRAAADARGRLSGGEPAQVSTARTRNIERRLARLPACRDGPAAVDRDAQHILADAGQVESAGAVQRPCRHRRAAEPDDEIIRREAVDERVPFERTVAHAHMADAFAVATDARLRGRSGLVSDPRRNIDRDGVASTPREIDRAGPACSHAIIGGDFLRP